MSSYRRLPLNGLSNARELGGFPIRGGGITRYGRFVRSELPERLDRSDMEFLEAYGIKLTIDFRSSRELKTTPSALYTESWLRYAHNPMISLEASHFAEADPELAAKLKNRDESSRRLGGIDWSHVYSVMAQDNKDWVKRGFDLIEAEPGCVHYHCMTGKDRTGVFTALLLGLAGVDDYDIIADYCVSQVYLRPFYLTPRDNDAAFTGDPDLSLSFYRTEPESMETFLAMLNDVYGSIRNYLTACEISDQSLDAVKASLVEY